VNDLLSWSCLVNDKFFIPDDQIAPCRSASLMAESFCGIAANRAGSLSECHGTTKQTVWKWYGRESVEDRSHTPHRLQTTLTSAQVVVELEHDPSAKVGDGPIGRHVMAVEYQAAILHREKNIPPSRTS